MSRSAPGETEFVQLVLERPLAAAAGDRFVLRDTSSSRTVGGGTFIDLRAPERRRRTPGRRAELVALAARDPAVAIDQVLAGTDWVALDGFAAIAALGADAVAAIVASLSLVVFALADGRVAMRPATWEALAENIGQTLDSFHAERPDLPGIGLEQLRKVEKPALPVPLFMAVLRRLIEARRGRTRPHLGTTPTSRGAFLQRGRAHLGADPAAP